MYRFKENGLRYKKEYELDLGFVCFRLFLGAKDGAGKGYLNNLNLVTRKLVKKRLGFGFFFVISKIRNFRFSKNEDQGSTL